MTTNELVLAAAMGDAKAMQQLQERMARIDALLETVARVMGRSKAGQQ